MRVKTDRYAPFVLDHELRDALARFERGDGDAHGETEFLRAWFAPRAREELLRFRSLLDEYEHADVLRVVLARAARSARLTTHFDLDFPKTPQSARYWCHKHRRECAPVEKADHFIRRYTLDTLARLKDFSLVRKERTVAVLHGDAAHVALSGHVFDAAEQLGAVHERPSRFSETERRPAAGSARGRRQNERSTMKPKKHDDKGAGGGSGRTACSARVYR